MQLCFEFPERQRPLFTTDETVLGVGKFPRLWRTWGLVYFVRDEHGLVKIGFTYELYGRIVSLRTGCPTRLKLVFVIATEDPEGLEVQLHQRFRERRQHREWFALTAEDVAAICDEWPVASRKEIGYMPRNTIDWWAGARSVDGGACEVWHGI